jgi:hypothetical protein
LETLGSLKSLRSLLALRAVAIAQFSLKLLETLFCSGVSAAAIFR